MRVDLGQLVVEAGDAQDIALAARLVEHALDAHRQGLPVPEEALALGQLLGGAEIGAPLELHRSALLLVAATSSAVLCERKSPCCDGEDGDCETEASWEGHNVSEMTEVIGGA
ncbi:MAG: hypothetical protein OHK0013_30760 [Sandaracinaceae bacterium]